MTDSRRQEEVEKYSEDLKDLQNVRETTTQIERPSDAGRDALLRYAAQLEALEPVFPVSETEVRVNSDLSWYARVCVFDGVCRRQQVRRCCGYVRGGLCEFGSPRR